LNPKTQKAFVAIAQALGAESIAVCGTEHQVKSFPLVLFTGSRDWDDYDTVSEMLDLLQRVLGRFNVIHGGAPGLDSVVDHIARHRGMNPEVVRPRYDLYHPKVAPKRRNVEMLIQEPDIVVGFWTGSEGGTTHCLEWAINVYRIPTMVITC